MRSFKETHGNREEIMIHPNSSILDKCTIGRLIFFNGRGSGKWAEPKMRSSKEMHGNREEFIDLPKLPMLDQKLDHSSDIFTVRRVKEMGLRTKYGTAWNRNRDCCSSI